MDSIHDQLTSSDRMIHDKLVGEPIARIASSSPNHEVVWEAVRLRELRRMALGDALVAAAALVGDRTLVTRNVRDFDWIPGLTVFNPMAE